MQEGIVYVYGVIRKEGSAGWFHAKRDPGTAIAERPYY